jgi:hypothetical protein
VGQEDWILDVALELARDSQVHPLIRHEAVEATVEELSLSSSNSGSGESPFLCALHESESVFSAGHRGGV